MSARLTFELQPLRYAVCRLEPSAESPAWLPRDAFASVTWTREETSVVCPEGVIPEGVEAEVAWRCLRIQGVLDFALVGVLKEVSTCLADAGVSLFCLSTFDTDYFLVRESDLETSRQALIRAGHQISRAR